MFESFLGFIRKRRRVDGEPGTSTPASSSSSNDPQATSSEFESPSPRTRPASYNTQVLKGNKSNSDCDADVVMGRALESMELIYPHDRNNKNLDSEANLLHSSAHSSNTERSRRYRAPSHGHSCEEAMEIDSTPVPPPQEYSDSPSQQHSESSMNFDYLSSLHSSSASPGGYNSGGGMDNTATGTGSALGFSSSFRKGTDSLAHVDDRAAERPFNLNERFVGVLDQLDARVEKFRKDAMGLQEKRDFLLMSIDLIKTNDLLQGMNEAEREEISCYIQRVNSRLSTVELNVRTVRDTSQEDSLSQINMLIDIMITLGDPVLSRQRCQQYLNACSSFDGSINMGSFAEHITGQDVIVDKKFECALLGCTLDDQKNVKKRLLALMGYLNKQTIRD